MRGAPVTAVLQLRLATFVDSEKRPFWSRKGVFEAVWEFGGPVLELEEQFLVQFGSLVDQF